LWRDHVAAGFDPETFWRMTPRAWLHMMAAAAEARRERRAAAVIDGFMAARADGADVERHIEALRGSGSTELPPEALEGMLRSQGATLEVINLDDYLKSKRG
jgi:DNA invertase Pin-like site-specific DNA recombinase